MEYVEVGEKGSMIRRLIYLLFLVGFASAALAQGTSVIGGQVVNLQGIPVPYATIRVCPQTATGTPCVPLSTIYSDPALSHQIANPTTANQYGIFSIFVNGSSQFYQVQTNPSTTITYNYYANGVAPGTGTVAGQAPQVVPLGTGPTIVGSQSHINEGTAGFTSVTQAFAPVRSAPAGPPSVDITNPTFGAIIDGATPIDSALTSAVATACTGTNGTGKLLIPANNGLGAFLQNGNLQINGVSGCAINNTPQFVLQGQLKLGGTLNPPSPSVWQADGGSLPNQFAFGQATAKIVAPVDHGTIVGSVTAGVQTFSLNFTAGSIADFIAGSTAVTLSDNLTCNIASTVVSGVNVTATLSAPNCDIMAGTKVTVAGTSNAELNTTPILLKGDYPAGTFYWDPATKAWAANTAFSVGDIVIDNTSNCALKVTRGVAQGQTQHCLQIVTVGGTSGGTQPTWNGTPGGTTSDNTVTWTNYEGSTSTGGTITGLNQSTYESVRVSAVAGSTLTANFMHAHPAGASWGMVAVAPKNGSFTNLTFNGIQVTGCYGACWWFEHSGDIHMDSSGGSVQQWPSAIPLEMASSFQWDIWHGSFLSTLPQNCFMNCSQTAYPCGIRLTTANSTDTPTDSTSFDTIDGHTAIGGCIEMDSNGRTGVANGGLYIANSFIEQPFQDGILVDPRNLTGSGVQNTIMLVHTQLQDNNLGFDPAIVGYTYPSPSALNPGVLIFDSLKINTVGFGRTIGKYYNGALTINGVGGQGHPQFPVRNAGPIGCVSDGLYQDCDSQTQGAGFAPEVMPFATANSTVNPSSWTCVGTGCSIVTGRLDPEGGTNAGELITGSGATPTIQTYTTTGTTTTGDWWITGVWCRTGTNAQVTQNCASTTQAAIWQITDSGSDKWDGTSAASPTVSIYCSDWRNTPWRLCISKNKITAGSAVSHTIAMKLLGQQTAGQGNIFFKPFAVSIPYSSKPADMSDAQWDLHIDWVRRQFYHGATPPNAAANQAYIDVPLNLPANPTTGLQAAPKQYVDTFAPLVSPNFTGTPTAPTAAGATNNTQIATTGFVHSVLPVVSIRAGTWSISAGTGVTATFSTPMVGSPDSCSVTPSSSAATTGTPFVSGRSSTAVVVNIPTSGTISGTYMCVQNNTY